MNPATPPEVRASSASPYVHATDCEGCSHLQGFRGGSLGCTHPTVAQQGCMNQVIGLDIDVCWATQCQGKWKTA